MAKDENKYVKRMGRPVLPTREKAFVGKGDGISALEIANGLVNQTAAYVGYGEKI